MLNKTQPSTSILEIFFEFFIGLEDPADKKNYLSCNVTT